MSLLRRVWVKDLLWILVTGLGIGLILRQIASNPEPTRPYAFAVNDKIQIPGVDFSASPRMLLLATSAACHYCNQSLTFHKTLVTTARAVKVPLLVLVNSHALLPKELAAHSGDFRTVYADLSKVGVPGTPTIALVSDSGKIVGLWVGQLNPGQERAVIARISGAGHTLTDNDEKVTLGLTDEALREELQKSLVLDVNDRADYARYHLPGAVNIPIDELAVRSYVELQPTGRPVVVDCSSGADSSRCDFSKAALREAGIAQIRFLDKGATGASCFRGAVR